MTEPSSPAQSQSPLRSLQEILHNRIVQKKGEIHESHIGFIMTTYGER
jgi:hypothetical protein